MYIQKNVSLDLTYVFLNPKNLYIRIKLIKLMFELKNTIT